MSTEANRWAEVGRDAGLTDDELAVLYPFLANLAQTNDLPHGRVTRVANRVWLEAQQPTAGSVSRRFVELLMVARAQVKLFGLPFWLVSITVMLAGAGAEAVGLDPGRTIAFYLAAPLLAYISTATAFRGQSDGPQELELATPVSARELLLVRLFLILIYDVVIGLVTSLPLAITGGSSLGAVTLSWLSPLLLITGATLLVTSWLPVERAGAVTYGAWAVAVLVGARFGVAPSSMFMTLELGMLTIGLVLFTVLVIIVPGRFKLTRARAAA